MAGRKINRVIQGVVLLTALGILVLGCAARSGDKIAYESAEVKVVNKPVPVIDKEQVLVNVYALEGENWSEPWQPSYGHAETAISNSDMTSNDTASKESIKKDSVEAIEFRESRGFRVQILNVIEEERALEVMSHAEVLFGKAYLLFSSPNYKVRIGNFERRSEADVFADSARGMGFRSAWVVPSKIEIPIHPVDK